MPSYAAITAQPNANVTGSVPNEKRLYKAYGQITQTTTGGPAARPTKGLLYPLYVYKV